MITAEEARKAANRVKAELKERTLKDILFLFMQKFKMLVWKEIIMLI